MLLIPKLHNKLWKAIDNHYSDDAIIWVVTDVTLKYLGYRLVGKKYVLQFLELADRLVYYKKLPQIALNAKKLCDNALAVVVPEYNRAHILKALWNINKMPVVIANRPYNHLSIEKDSEVDDDRAREVLSRIENRRLILYQGVIGKERPLEPLIRAVSSLGDEYAFVVMSGGKNIYAGINSKNYYFIPFVAPPGHLQITSHAYIGVLSYEPTKETGYSILNTLYCAPNKIYEFAQFGIPMIGNDNPGLNYLFKTEHIGEIFPDWSENSIRKTILTVEQNITYYSENSKKFFARTDIKDSVIETLHQISINL